MNLFKILFGAMALGAILLTSCGNNQGAGNHKLDGKWRVVQATGEIIGPNEGTEYIFEDGKKLTTRMGTSERKGDIVKMTSSAVHVKFEGVHSEFIFDYKLNGKKLVLELRNSDGQVFNLERQ
jgi:hypothetical protein